MPITEIDIARGMVDQLRLLDPGISAEIGTPERKIIDVVASALANAQVDLSVLSGSLNVDAKVGSDLDNFLKIFGFGRQQATYARGFVTFLRATPSTVDIHIPVNTGVLAPGNATGFDEAEVDVRFATSYTTSSAAVLTAGTTEVIVPVQAAVAGAAGNVNAYSITGFPGLPPAGITGVEQTTPITGGLDQEADDEFKVRFRNTVFRNLSGTSDQYIALAASTAFTTRANVVGPVSRYREYVQVPTVDDATPYDVDNDGTFEGGGGNAGEYTTALSTVPYSKHVYDSQPVFLSNGLTGPLAVFYREDFDFTFNVDPASKDRGDTKRFYSAATPIGNNPLTNDTTANQPNITLTNIYTGTSSDVQAIRPGDIVLLEHAYLSSASRNDVDRNITNCVDIFIDGENPVLADTIIPRPSLIHAFVDNPISPYYVNNYRRIGYSEVRPIIGNILSPLYQQPILDVPDQITALVGLVNHTFYKNTHYWAVTDVSEIGGTIRSRSGIEWSTNEVSKLDGDDVNGPYTGSKITSLPPDTALEITGYTFDQNLIDLQSSFAANKQITTDVLAHRARIRYFKLDVSVMYTPGVSITATNTSIYTVVNQFFKSASFGSAIQLSDLIQSIHNIVGVDNVRWSSDVPGASDLSRVLETDRFGRPLLNVNIQRITTGSSSPSVGEVQRIAIAGTPTGGTYTLTWAGNTTAPISYDADSTTVATALNSSPVNANVTVSGAGIPDDPFVVSFITHAITPLITSDATQLSGGATVVAGDFFLRDNELAELPEAVYTSPSGVSDTTPGLIIRVRAQNTWNSR